MSRNRFLCICLVLAVVFSGAVTPLFQPSVAVAAQPATPTNSSPGIGAVGVSLTPTLTASPFDDPGDSHLASRWEVATSASHDVGGDGSYLAPSFDSGIDGYDLVSIPVPSGELGSLITYYWHVRYLDDNLIWSEWSAETPFTTTGPQPNQPTNESPSNGATGVGLTPTLQSSLFSDNNTSDTHFASQWQIRLDTGDYITPEYDSGTDTANKTSITVPSGKLGYSVTYYWHVRHQDNSYFWSEWSAETSFATMANQPPDTPNNSLPANGAPGQPATLTLQSLPFSDDVGDTHAASQWQIRSVLGNYTSPVYDNITTVNLTNTVIPADTLSYLTMYYWHVRYQDNYGEWSGYSAEWSFITSADQPPNQPTNLAPANGAGGQSLTPTLAGLAFVDPDPGDTHLASQWQITTISGDYTTGLVFDNVTSVNLTSIEVPLGLLTYFTTYYWHVSYQDNNGAWSTNSAEWSFTTLANQAPSQPANSSPANGATNQPLTPTLQALTFSDPEGDAHAASRWQITTTAGNYDAPVFDSGTDNTNLTSIAVPSGRLLYSTTYYWHVSYQDSFENWSVPSAETSFATAVNQAPNPPTNTFPANLATDISLTPTLTSSAFNDPGDTQLASQWQVTTMSGNYASPVFDSGTDTLNLVSIAVPSGRLDYSTTYYWHVRHLDSQSVPSAWSSETSFTTRPPGPGADFSADVTALIAGQAVQFADASTGQVVSWQWDFGDGTTPTTWTTRPSDGKVSHTYAVAGTYDVLLTVIDSKSVSHAEKKPGYINVFALPQAGFSASATGIPLGDAISFTSLSTGGVPPLTYAWDFDSDGVVDSSSLNPTYSYAAAGTYTVTLKVTDSRGNSATEMKTSYIAVGNAVAPHSIPPLGGIIQTADGQIAMTFPTEAVAGVATISIEPASPPAATKLPGGYRMGNTCFTVSAVDGEGKEILMFARLVTITVKYSDGDVAAAGGDLNDLVLAYYNEATGKWKVVDTALNRTDKSLSVSTTHFSTWAVMAKTSSNGPASWQWVIIGLAAVLVAGIVMWKLIPARRPYREPHD